MAISLNIIHYLLYINIIHRMNNIPRSDSELIACLLIILLNTFSFTRSPYHCSCNVKCLYIFLLFSVSSSLSLFLSLSHSPSLSVCFPFSISVYLSPAFSLSLPLSLCMSLSLYLPLSLCLSVYPSLSPAFSLPLSLYLPTFL